jgi:hypothetical protein
MIMGIIGLYLGKTFIQGKYRPRYIIQSSNIEYDKYQTSPENEPKHKDFKKFSTKVLH